MEEYSKNFSFSQEVEEFFTTHSLYGASRAINQTLDTIAANIKWVETNAAQIGQLLAA